MSKQRYDRYPQRDWARLACRSWDELGIAQSDTTIWVTRLGFPYIAPWVGIQLPPHTTHAALAWLRTRLCDSRVGYYWGYAAPRTRPLPYNGTGWWNDLCRNS